MSGVTLENLKRGIDAALGRRKSCLALTNAKVVDVMNCEVSSTAAESLLCCTEERRSP